MSVEVVVVVPAGTVGYELHDEGEHVKSFCCQGPADMSWGGLLFGVMYDSLFFEFVESSAEHSWCEVGVGLEESVEVVDLSEADVADYEHGPLSS